MYSYSFTRIEYLSEEECLPKSINVLGFYFPLTGLHISMGHIKNTNNSEQKYESYKKQ